MKTLSAHVATALCLAILLGVTAPVILTAAPIQAQTDAASDAASDATIVAQLSGPAQAIVAAINQQRANAGLNALAVNDLLNQAAQGQATDMMVNYNYSHSGSDGSTVKIRVARTGYAADPWVSENWVSSRSVDGAMRWWMNDYIHRVNILTAHWEEVGVGVATRPSTGEMIFVTVFSVGRDDAGVQPSVVPAAAPAAPAIPLPAVDVPAGGMDYTIRSGDTLLGIAARHSLDWRVVAAANGLNEASILQIGQVIRLPGVEAAAGLQFEDDGTTGSTLSTASTEQGTDFEQDAAPATPPVPTEPYSVQSGDTLFSIAARNGITWQELAGLNGFAETELLQIDQVIQIPARATDDTPPPPATPADGPAAEDPATDNPATEEPAPILAAAVTQPTAESPAESPTGVVAAGFTAEAGIAEAPVAEAAPTPALQVQAASLSTPDATPATASVTESALTHIVQPGDTVISIALRYAVDWQELLRVNGFSENTLLQLGQEIRLP